MASLARFTSLALTLLAAVVGEPAGATDEPDDFLGCTILVLKPGTLFKVVCPGTFDLPDQPANDPTLNGTVTMRLPAVTALGKVVSGEPEPLTVKADCTSEGVPPPGIAASPLPMTVNSSPGAGSFAATAAIA